MPATPDARNVESWLLEQGLIEPEAIVHGELTVDDMSRRNRVLVVRSTVGRSFVVKCGASVPREAEVLERIAGATGGGPSAGLVPVVVLHDARANVLVTVTRHDAHDLVRHHRRHARGRFSAALARSAGAVLARLHRLPAAIFDDLPGGLRAAGLRVHRPRLDALGEMSMAEIELVALIQSRPEVCGELDALDASASAAVPVHGDVRWDNCLALAGARSGRRDRVAFVDWEQASVGDPCVDVGAFLGEYLRAWVQAIPIVDPRRPGLLLANTRAPLSRMQPATRAFWSAYARGSGREPERLRAMLRRATRLAAVRMLGAAIEEAHGTSTLRATVRFELQLVANVLRSPDAAACSAAGDRRRVSGYFADQLMPALTAVRVTSDTTYSWFGRRSAAPAPAVRAALAPQLARAYLVTRIADELYGSFYVRGRPVSVAQAEHPVGGRADDAFVAALSAANSGRGGWERGWTIAGEEGPGLRVERDGLRVSAAREDCRPAGDDGAVDLRRSKEQRALSPGFYLARGDVERAQPIEARLYFNLRASGAVAFVRSATSLLNEAGVGFALKVVAHPGGFVRCDAGVLYLDPQDFDRARAPLRTIVAACARNLEPAQPAFAKPLAPGVGVGEHARAHGGSFGTSRCRLTAEGIVAARRHAGTMLAAVRERFAAAGLDVDRPYLVGGAVDRYAL